MRLSGRALLWNLLLRSSVLVNAGPLSRLYPNQENAARVLRPADLVRVYPISAASSSSSSQSEHAVPGQKRRWFSVLVPFGPDFVTDQRDQRREKSSDLLCMSVSIESGTRGREAGARGDETFSNRELEMGASDSERSGPGEWVASARDVTTTVSAPSERASTISVFPS